MSKRRNPFEADSCHQLKTHIGQKEVSRNSDADMHHVYERTLKLLADGSRQHQLIGGSDCTKVTSDGFHCVDMEEVPHDQLRLDFSGRLYHSDVVAAVGETDDVAMAVCDDENNSFDCANRNELAARAMNCVKKSFHPASDSLSSMGIRCYSCRSLIAAPPAGAAKCNWCDKLLCERCVRHCCRCSLAFCHVCSLSNYDDHFERTFCLQCLQSNV